MKNAFMNLAKIHKQTLDQLADVDTDLESQFYEGYKTAIETALFNMSFTTELMFDKDVMKVMGNVIHGYPAID